MHLVMPAAAFDAEHGLWRSLRKTRKGGHYLFNHKALAAVFRGKLLAALNAEGLTVPVCLPERWVVDKQERGQWTQGTGLSGALPVPGCDSRDIVRCAQGQVTFRYRDSGSGKNTLRTVSGAHFLWLVLQHVLPKGFRRSRNFGLAHPNCKHRQRLTLLRMGLKPSAAPACMTPCTPGLQPPSAQPRLSERPKLQCRCCGSAMVIVRRRIASQASKGGAAGPPGAAREGQMT